MFHNSEEGKDVNEQPWPAKSSCGKMTSIIWSVDNLITAIVRLDDEGANDWLSCLYCSFFPPAGASGYCKCLLSVQVTVRLLVLMNTAGEKETWLTAKLVLEQHFWPGGMWRVFFWIGSGLDFLIEIFVFLFFRRNYTSLKLLLNTMQSVPLFLFFVINLGCDFLPPEWLF